MSLSNLLDVSRRRRGLAAMLQESRRKRQRASSLTGQSPKFSKQRQQRTQQQRRPPQGKLADKWASPSFGAVSVDRATDTRGREWLNLRSNLPGSRGLRFGWSMSEGRWGLGRVPPIELVREAHAHGWDQFPIPSPEEVDIAGFSKASPQTRVVQNNAGFKVGDILVAIWGYDQTNVDFYEVVGITKGTIDLCSINKRTDRRATGASYVVPVPGTCTGTAVRKRTRAGSDRVVAPRYGTAFRWSGRPMYQTAGGWGH